MGRWWEAALIKAYHPFYSQPWDTWFWAQLPAPGSGYPADQSATGWPGWEWGTPPYYWFYKISPSGGHQQQLAIKSSIDMVSTSSDAYSVKANVVYILTYQDDTPNWGTSSSLVAISPPCGNWKSGLYETPNEVTRSQTYSIQAAVQSNRQKTATIRAAIALTGSLDCSIVAAIQGQPELPVSSLAAIQGDRQLPVPMRAAVRTERLLEWNMIAAVGKDFELPSSVVAAVRGNPQKYHGMRAACKGEAEKKVGIIAFVVKSRADTIYLEFENKWPQEFGFTTIQNAPSETKDYRKQGIS